MFYKIFMAEMYSQQVFMPETIDCVCFTKDFLKLTANFEFVYCCHGNRSRKDQTAKTVLFIMF